MSIPRIGLEDGEAFLDWHSLTEVLAEDHARVRANVDDSFLYRGTDTLLTKSAWIDGLGLAVKAETVFPRNRLENRPETQGVLNLLSDEDGSLEAIIDARLVNKWATAGCSVLAARRLARPDSAAILIVGEGEVAVSLREAYGAVFPNARFLYWTPGKGGMKTMASKFPGMNVVGDLQAAMAEADIVSCATTSIEPFLKGEWLRPGQHVDLVGSIRPDMREAHNSVFDRVRLFVDSFETAVDHVGEIRTPLIEGTITEEEIIADLYELDRFRRKSASEITLFKNGGGAHLDLMTARYIFDRWIAARQA